MTDNNICKFNTSRSSELICYNFIYETTDRQNKPLTADTHMLGFTLNGIGTVSINSANDTISRGDIFLIRKGDSFSVDPSASLEYAYISFGGRRANELTDRLKSLSVSRIFKGHEYMADFWVECLHKAEDDNLDLFSESVLLYTLAHLEQKQKKQSDAVSDLLTYIGENFASTDLSLSTLAVQLKYAPKYLSFLFKKETGVSFTEYLRSIRLKHAVFLFEQGVESVKNVSILSGFKDSMYFSKQFKREFGLSPVEYVKDIKQRKKNSSDTAE